MTEKEYEVCVLCREAEAHYEVGVVDVSSNIVCASLTWRKRWVCRVCIFHVGFFVDSKGFVRLNVVNGDTCAALENANPDATGTLSRLVNKE
jgi:hypothetical protein